MGYPLEVIGDRIYLEGQLVAVIFTTPGTSIDKTFRRGLKRLEESPLPPPPRR
jgi:hypothetical protein